MCRWNNTRRYGTGDEFALLSRGDEYRIFRGVGSEEGVLPSIPQLTTETAPTIRAGQAERGTHDYARNGTTSLFAALNVATGRVIGTCDRRHRRQEFLKFLHAIDAAVPAEDGVTVRSTAIPINPRGQGREWPKAT